MVVYTARATVLREQVEDWVFEVDDEQVGEIAELDDGDKFRWLVINGNGEMTDTKSSRVRLFTDDVTIDGPFNWDGMF
jgi:hypothetical protein